MWSLVKIRCLAGFSLIELVTVLILLGVVGVFALGRFAGQDSIAARGFFDDTVNAVRFAQKLATTSGCDVRVQLVADGYSLQQSTSCGDNDFTRAVLNPADRANAYQVSGIPNGFNLTVGTLIFDARGICETCAIPSSGFTVSNGSLSYGFRVFAETGLVEVI